MAQYTIANGITPVSSAEFIKVTTGTGLKTMLQVKPGATIAAKIIAWGYSCSGFAAAAPGSVELIETDVAATVTASVAGDISKSDAMALLGGDPTTALVSVGTAATGYTATVEGSIGTTRYLDGPQQAAPTTLFSWQFPLGQEPVIQAAKFARIRVHFAAAIDMMCWMKIEV